MFKNIKAAISHYLNSNPQVKELLDKYDCDLAIESLPSEYDNTPFCTIVNGNMVYTLGEYKAECDKNSSIY